MGPQKERIECEGKEVNVKRRRFIKNLGIAGMGLPFISSRINAQSVCMLTTTDLYGLGPFYLSGMPGKSILAPENEPGERLKISGTVFSNNCESILSQSIVEVWQADENGCYHHRNSCGMGEDYHLYGALNLDEQGRYSYETILPGKYLNGAQYRPRHIHYRAVAPDGKVLVTQLYFEGDEHIQSDLAAGDPSALGRIIPLSKAGEVWEGQFDLVLDSASTDVKDDVKVIRNNSRFRILDEGNNIRISLFLGNVLNEKVLEIVDSQGRVKLKEILLDQSLVISKEKLSTGVYRAVVRDRQSQISRNFYVIK